MKILFIAGSYPPATCGVGDYTYRLVESLQAMGMDVEVITNMSWSVLNIISITKRVNKYAPDILHIQYPTVGFGKKLGPQLITVLDKCIVTIHEVSQAHFLRKLSLLPFLIHSKHIFFTNSFERDYAIRYVPSLVYRSSIIPVGSHIPIGKHDGDRDSRDIIYFGLLRPNRGLEDIFNLASIIKRAGSAHTIRIIGKTHPLHFHYFQNLYQTSKKLPIVWDLNLPEDEVAILLARSQVAYVPFPDGASERRTSLLALLASGVATITTRGDQTPLAMNDVVEFAKSPDDALNIIQMLSLDEVRRINLGNLGRNYAKNFAWEEIASMHVSLYEKILSGPTK